MKRTTSSALILLAGFIALGDDSCERPGEQAARAEANVQGAAYRNIIRNQPAPSFDYSLERKIVIALYEARQKSVATYAYIQSEYTGKVLWSCPSIGYPIPYSTQMTNPNQVVSSPGTGNVAIPQNEPNGLFPPSMSQGTWVPCTDEHGQITPVYEEKNVTVFLRPMQEQNGQLIPTAGGSASLTIKP